MIAKLKIKTRFNSNRRKRTHLVLVCPAWIPDLHVKYVKYCKYSTVKYILCIGIV